MLVRGNAGNKQRWKKQVRWYALRRRFVGLLQSGSWAGLLRCHSNPAFSPYHGVLHDFEK
jgi:hypothetical protein